MFFNKKVIMNTINFTKKNSSITNSTINRKLIAPCAMTRGYSTRTFTSVKTGSFTRFFSTGGINVNDVDARQVGFIIAVGSSHNRPSREVYDCFLESYGYFNTIHM
jgi:hypothetical protein